MARCRNSTTASLGHLSRATYAYGAALTAFSIANDAIQSPDEIREDGIDVIQPSQHRYDVGAGICVFLGQDRGEECCESLCDTVRDVVMYNRSECAPREHGSRPLHPLSSRTEPPGQIAAVSAVVGL